MPDEELGIVDDNLPEGEVDPLADTPEDGQVDETPEPEGDDQPDVGQDLEEESGEDDPLAPLSETSFKDVKSLVDGYKNIQRLAQEKENYNRNLLRQVEILLKKANEKREADAGQPIAKEDKLPEGQAFWDALAADPAKLIRQIARAEQESFYKNTVDPRLGKVESGFSISQRQAVVNDFLSRHPKLAREDENQIVEILEANPWLKDRNDGIDIAYDRVLAGRYRESQSKNSTTKAVASAKKVAGLGGKKTSIPVPAKEDKDPFDEVLEMDREEQELYKLGRK